MIDSNGFHALKKIALIEKGYPIRTIEITS